MSRQNSQVDENREKLKDANFRISVLRNGGFDKKLSVVILTCAL